MRSLPLLVLVLLAPLPAEAQSEGAWVGAPVVLRVRPAMDRYFVNDAGERVLNVSTTLFAGERVVRLEGDEWWRVRASDGTEGYLRKAELVDGAAEPATVLSPTTTYGRPDLAGLDTRRKLEASTLLFVLSEEGAFAEVVSGRLRAWVRVEDLTRDPAEVQASRLVTRARWEASRAPKKAEALRTLLAASFGETRVATLELGPPAGSEAPCGKDAPCDPPELLLPGQFHGDEVSAPDGATFLALCGARLESLALKITPAFDEVVDEEGAPPTGKQVGAGCEDPVFFVRGVAVLRSGPAVHAEVKEQTAGTAWRISWSRGEARVLREQVGPTGYRLILEAGGTRSILVEHAAADDGGQQSVAWAGDVDLDGNLDLLLNASNHYNVSEYLLLLSRPSETASPVVVATFRAVGC